MTLRRKHGFSFAACASTSNIAGGPVEPRAKEAASHCTDRKADRAIFAQRSMCQRCARTLAADGRHWISCPHGLRLQRSVHHPVRDTLAWLLTAVLGERMVIRETPDGGGRMGSFMRRFPGLGHQPDIVLEGFDGRDSYTILEVKTCEPAGDAWIARQHTDTSRGAAHRHLVQTLAPSQYTIPAHQPACWFIQFFAAPRRPCGFGRNGGPSSGNARGGIFRDLE